jgi:uncharacterized membrane protein YhaH (DUF805 family)
MYLLSLLFSPKGKIDRLEFLGGYLFTIFVPAALLYWGGYLGSSMQHPDGDDLLKLLEACIYLLSVFIFVFVTIVLAIKRLRDMGLTAWLTIFFLVPVVGFFMKIVAISKPGKNV